MFSRASQMSYLKTVVLIVVGTWVCLGQTGTDAANANGQASSTPDKKTAQPALTTTVTVVGSLTSESPASISVIDQEQLQAIPGSNLDDRLRQVPGFSLFRRSSSVVANPTTQGVSLRATGSSGASRTLVLWDGIPLNDPFGGWVYWTRIDPAFVDRVEVDRGGTTAVFGDRALGGNISLFAPPAQQDHLFCQLPGWQRRHAGRFGCVLQYLGPVGLYRSRKRIHYRRLLHRSRFLTRTSRR